MVDTAVKPQAGAEVADVTWQRPKEGGLWKAHNKQGEEASHLSNRHMGPCRGSNMAGSALSPMDFGVRYRQ